MGRTRTLALIAAMAVSAAAPGSASAGAGEAPRRYKVDQVRAVWELPRSEPGRSRMYWLEGARYEDLESGEVLHFATATRMECKRRGTSVSCDSDLGGYRDARGTPTEFTFAEDMSRASLAFERRGAEHLAQWTAMDAADRPFEFLPGTYGRSEGCPSGEGTGHGLYRTMQAQGSVFGRDLDASTNGGIVGIARFVLETECSPEQWWRASSLPKPADAAGQWLRRADTSSFLSMLERPSIPTS